MLKLAKWWRSLDWTERGGLVMIAISLAFLGGQILAELIRD